MVRKACPDGKGQSTRVGGVGAFGPLRLRPEKGAFGLMYGPGRSLAPWRLSHRSGGGGVTILVPALLARRVAVTPLGMGLFDQLDRVGHDFLIFLRLMRPQKRCGNLMLTYAACDLDRCHSNNRLNSSGGG